MFSRLYVVSCKCSIGRLTLWAQTERRIMFWFIVSIIFVVGGFVGFAVKRSYAKKETALEAAGRDTESAHFSALVARVAGWVALVIGVVILLMTVIRIVPANNVGIPTSFGSIGSPMQSGLQFTAPWTEITNFSTRVQELSMLRAEDEGDLGKDDSIQVIAKGGGSMGVDMTVRFYIDKKEASSLFRQAGNLDLVKDRFVRPDAREVARNVFGKFSAEEGYSTKRGDISERIFTELKPRLARRGIIVDSVNIRDVNPESNVLKAINNILRARNDAIRVSEVQKKEVTQAETRKQVAERDASAAVTKAQGEANALRISAEAEATANSQIAASLTGELARLKAIIACAAAIEKTNATVVNVCGDSVAGNSGGGSTVVIDGRK